jgi:cytochrome c-type biogenesis protein CcmH/NrfG
MSSRALYTSLLMAFLLVAGIGAATFHWRDSSAATVSGGTIPLRSGPDGEMLSRLESYVRSTGTEQPVSEAAARELLPDVNTMIQRLAARLEAAPEDSKGWRMLGWSYFNTGHYEQAASAYAKAAKLDPNSAELKLAYEEAKAKASGPRVAENSKSEAMPPGEQDAAIRAMVDGLAHRLESAPRDVEGWARLMRSRVVLGERGAATTALRKALEVFKDDPAASGRIAAAAMELGLKAH